MTATLPSCTAPWIMAESDSRFMGFNSPSGLSGSPSLSSSVGGMSSYSSSIYGLPPTEADLADRNAQFMKNISSGGYSGGSSSLRSGISSRDPFVFPKFDSPSGGGSPSLDSRIEKIDFSSLGKPKEDSPSLDSLIKNIPMPKPFAVPRFDSPLNFGGSSSLRSGIGGRDYSPQFNYLDTVGEQQRSGHDFANQRKYHDWNGPVWSESFKPHDQLYGKNLGEDTQLHVHINFDGLVTGAKIKNLLNSTEVGISNYEATILDLNLGKSWSQKPKASTKW